MQLRNFLGLESFSPDYRPPVHLARVWENQYIYFCANTLEVFAQE